MNFLNNARIGTRLGIGFAVVLMLSILSTAIGLYSARSAAESTRKMMESPLAKERIVADWYVFIYSAIARTSIIAKSSDDTIPKTFAEDISQSVKRGGELQKSLEPLLTSAAEKEMYAKISDLRKTYQADKEATMKAKLSGNAELAAAAFEKNFIPSSRAYQAQVLEFLKLQRGEIDAMAHAIDQAYQTSFNLMILLGVLLVALSVACAYLIARSITVPIRAAVDVATRVAQGDLTNDIVATGKDEIGELLTALKGMNAGLVDIIRGVQTGAGSIANASGEIASGNLDLSSRTEQQAGSLEESRRDDGRTDLHRQAQCRERAAGQPARPVGVADRGQGWRSGGASGRDHGLDQRFIEKDRRHHRCHRWHRVPDEYPRAQRGGGSGASR